MQIVGITDIGRERKDNQDSVLYKVLGADRAIFVVCDGMGGAQAGNVASRMASEAYVTYIEQHYKEDMNVRSIKSVLKDAVTYANLEVFRESNSVREYAGMGTTLVGGLIHGDQVVLANVGDSRCYMDDGTRIDKITRDHSVVEELVLAGEITPEEARVHPHRNLITRAMGTDNRVKADLYPLKLLKGQVLLLCSDGLSNMLEDSELHTLLADASKGLQEKAQAMIDAANANGGSDNITVLLVSPALNDSGDHE